MMLYQFEGDFDRGEPEKPKAYGIETDAPGRKGEETR